MTRLLDILIATVGVFLLLVGLLAVFNITDLTQWTLPLVTIWVGFLLVGEAL